jgi:glutathionyl-hydroquinone reductase
VAESFSVSSEVAADGRFARRESAFRRRVSVEGLLDFKAAPGRYHLYVCLACPWSQRAIIARRLKGLEDVVGISYADPYRDERGWAFTGGEFSDRVNGWDFLSEAYLATDAHFKGRVTVPVLWDKETRQIVNNESADIMRIFNGGFGALADESVDLYPQALRDEIDEVNRLVYEDVNNGVYKAGFARSQAAYDEAFENLFIALDGLEQRLSQQRYLVGPAPTEADWRLFVTLVRFDAVYYSHFKCNLRRLIDYPALWGYTRDLYQHPGIAATVALDQIKRHYYTTHDMLNPSRIIPLGPHLDFGAPHERARLE